MDSNRYTASIQADYSIDFLHILGADNNLSLTTEAQNGEYGYTNGTISAGSYEVFAETADNIYGPLVVNTVNGALGNLDFTGVPTCPDSICGDD